MGELMIVKKQLQETVHSTLYMLSNSDLSCFVSLLVLSCLLCNCCWLTVCIVVVVLCVLLS